MRSVVFILLGILLDGLQALVSVSLMTIAAAPGTALGAASGCAAGNWIAGQIGCWIGGLVVGIASTAADPWLAPFTIPVGIVLGFAINICLSFTLGAGLLAAMFFSGMFYPKYWMGGIAEILPGINNIPFWTGLTILCVLRKNAEEGNLGFASAAIGTLLAPGTAAGRAALGVKNMRQESVEIAESVQAFNSPRLPQQWRAYAAQQEEQGDWLERADISSADQNELDAAQRTRLIMNDIKPAKRTVPERQPAQTTDEPTPTYANIPA